MSRIIVPGQPVGEPRQSQRDKWNRLGVRPEVERYRSWRDRARWLAHIAHGPEVFNECPLRVDVRSFFSLERVRLREDECAGAPFRRKPDFDNVLKTAADALWKRDERIAFGSVECYWDDGDGPRVEISWE